MSTVIVTGDPSHGGAVNVADAVIGLQMVVRGEWLEIQVERYTVRMDAADPEVSVASSSTHPGAGVDALRGKRFKLDAYV